MAKRRQTIDPNLFARTDSPSRKDADREGLHASMCPMRQSCPVDGA
jgi:hypothetical protein